MCGGRTDLLPGYPAPCILCFVSVGSTLGPGRPKVPESLRETRGRSGVFPTVSATVTELRGRSLTGVVTESPHGRVTDKSFVLCLFIIVDIPSWSIMFIKLRTSLNSSGRMTYPNSFSSTNISNTKFFL